MNKRYLKAPIIFLGDGKRLEESILVIDENGFVENISQNIEVPADQVIEYFDGALCPGFINTHCHLELSHLEGKIQEKTKLNGFIKELQAIRKAEEDEEVIKALNEADSQMQKNGIVAVADICNDSVSFQ